MTNTKPKNTSPLIETIRAAAEERSKQGNQQTGMPEDSHGSKPVMDEPVNLSIKVGKAQRLHWLIEAKRHDTNLTQAVIEALTTRFGMPN